ncbi:MAG: hypothetical protein U1E56_03570 [Bauldia sp.]
MAEHRIFPHGPLEQLGPGVWQVRGGLPMPITRNMVVVRLANGDLFIHSAVALNDRGFAELERAGRPRWVVVPSLGHQMDAPFYKERYPEAAILAPAAIADAVASKVEIAGSVEEQLPKLGIGLHLVPGLKTVEYVYEVGLTGGGRMLIVNDALGHGKLGADGLVGSLFNLAGTPGGRVDVPRLFRMAFTSDVAAVRGFFAKLGGLPGLKLLTVSHGLPVRDDVAGRLRAMAPA